MTVKRLKRFVSAVAILAALILGLMCLAPQSGTLVEPNKDRPGMDYRNFDLSEARPELCQTACESDARCKAYTYVKPGVQGPHARCWLKSGVPNAVANECCISGVKNVTVANPPPPGSLPLDLVADGGFDLNGIPLNPRWNYQTTPGLVRNAVDLCETDRFESACTTQRVSRDLPGWWNEIWCDREAVISTGHINWFPATYAGKLSNFSKAERPFDDDDYTMTLYTPDDRGALAGSGGHVHLEFSSGETIDQFQSEWWSNFHAGVDDDGDAGGDEIIAGHRAIVTGLMGIDGVHTPGAELHPVWALAIQNYAGWAFFVRTWGNEGYCSQQQHYFDGLPSGVYTFKLPWEIGYGARGQEIPATDVSILPPQVYTYGVPFQYARVTFSTIRGQAVLVSFQLPPRGGGGNSFYEGQINLRWQFPPGTNPPPPPTPPNDPCERKPPPPTCEVNAAERTLEGLLGPKLSDSQKAAIAAKLKPSPWTGRTRLSQDAIHVDRLDHLPSPPTSRPTTRASFDEKKAARDKLQHDLLKEAFHGAVPGFSESRPSSPPDR